VPLCRDGEAKNSCTRDCTSGNLSAGQSATCELVDGSCLPTDVSAADADAYLAASKFFDCIGYDAEDGTGCKAGIIRLAHCTTTSKFLLACNYLAKPKLYGNLGLSSR
jgi:hypothetical protein